MISFEAGVGALKGFIGRSGDEACCADETDALHAAFRAKATVHAGPIGLPMPFGAARSKLEALSHETRTMEAVAHVPFCSAEVLLFFAVRAGSPLSAYFLRTIGRGTSPSDHLSKRTKLRMIKKRATGASMRRSLLRACRREEKR